MEDRLGPEFANAMFLSISEVKTLLEYFKREGYMSASNNPLFEQIFAYVKRYDRFPDIQVSDQAKNMLQEHHFQDAEIAMLMNLCPHSAEEARSLIPELNRIESDEELNATLEELVRLKNL
ncbi:unnamed protein product [Blepharisma stoltei]|uniref:RNA polymerase Rpb4/RPC9 core domain-containing protein n=1 Tax=Blepharisma stoltei TaxID=1481888 RepID=A0AAU9K092_9CILI|nr:unnamed protein product [Blepharisma stoltei]